MDDATARFDFERFMRLAPSDMQRRMHDAATLTVNRIHTEAKAADMSEGSRATYLSNVAIVDVTEKSFAIELRGMLPNILEQGLGPGGIGTYNGSLFDMRTFILKPGTRNLRYTNAGVMYVNVPMKHPVEQIAAMGGKAAVHLAKNLAPTLTDPQQRRPTIWGDRLGPGLGPKKPHWTTDALDGLVRQQTTYSQATQATYKTWRRITELGHGNDASWWSKGVEPRGIFKKVAAKLGEILAMVEW